MPSITHSERSIVFWATLLLAGLSLVLRVTAAAGAVLGAVATSGRVIGRSIWAVLRFGPRAAAAVHPLLGVGLVAAVLIALAVVVPFGPFS